jgi:hypothetical protein
VPDPALRLDSGAQSRRRRHLGRRAPHERDRALLLGEEAHEFRRGRHLLLERAAAIRRQGSVRQRRQFREVRHIYEDTVPPNLFPE